MSKNVTEKNRELFIKMSIVISTNRKLRGMSQEELAEKAGVSRSLLSAIEAPRLAHNFTMDVFCNIADALDILPHELFQEATEKTLPKKST